MLALAATSDLFNDDDCANKIMPALCSSLIDKEKYERACDSTRGQECLLIRCRLVRDQANKTFELYLQRARKYANSLPDSILPPPSNSIVNGAGPRMGTSQNDSSWAGWAISSFTNKIATASGEMQAKSSLPEFQARPGNSRPSSMPPITDRPHPARVSASASTLHRKALTSNNHAPILTRTSTDQFFEDAQNEDDEVDQAWGDMDEEPFFDASSEPEFKAELSATAYDHGGEPDFEGWLTAHAQAKTKAPLFKESAKSSTAIHDRPSIAIKKKGPLSSGVVAAKPIKTEVKPKVATLKTINTKPKEASTDDDWGDAWD